MSEEKSKEGVKAENDHISLKVARVSRPVQKREAHSSEQADEAYCERQGLSVRQIRSRFNGQPVHEAATPSQLETEDEGTIDVFQQRSGVHAIDGFQPQT